MANVLVFNSGSSSLKFALFQMGSALKPLLEGRFEAIGSSAPLLTLRDHDQLDNTMDTSEQMAFRQLSDEGAAIHFVIGLLLHRGLTLPAVVGHRVVHGGPSLRRHCHIDVGVRQTLRDANAFAPLHMPMTLAVINAAVASLPGTPQVACFDTSFHMTMPASALTLPIDRRWLSFGLQRYGFHGISCESIVGQFGKNLPPRMIVAHLGSGASVTAVRDGYSIDTTMGVTPTGGVLMSSRSGDLDPGLIIHLMREFKLSVDHIEVLVTQQSGLRGVSGRSGDLRELRSVAHNDAHAALAIAMFCQSIAKAIAGMVTALDGVDAPVFTGGIGENDAQTRAEICARLSCVGLSLDEGRNNNGDSCIQAPNSRCRIQVLPAREEQRIALHAIDLCAADGRL